MIIVDTGPLVALLAIKDQHADQVRQTFARLSGRMLTTDACITEVMHLLGRGGGWRFQDSLFRMIETGILAVCPQDGARPIATRTYMQRFADTPCDYADATLLVAAEETGIRRIFTLDKHFYAYRLTSGEALEVIL